MFRLGMGLFIIILGIVFILLAIYHKPKEIMKKNVQNKSLINEYLKYEKTANILEGIILIILGILAILNLLTGKQVGLLIVILELLDRIFIFGLRKKYSINI